MKLIFHENLNKIYGQDLVETFQGRFLQRFWINFGSFGSFYCLTSDFPLEFVKFGRFPCKFSTFEEVFVLRTRERIKNASVLHKNLSFTIVQTFETKLQMGKNLHKNQI